MRRYAVHRLLAWYREGANVQRWLPHLSTYLGHARISSTQRYLTMIPELLEHASQRFERLAALHSLERFSVMWRRASGRASDSALNRARRHITATTTQIIYVDGYIR